MAEFVSLYRKYRPDTWDKVIGQNHIVTTLINQIKSGAISHAYLFTGTRGTGKTSSAKIFAKALNCLHPVNGSPCNKCEVCLALSNESNLDVVEMDAASNNGVDSIRDLREKVQFPPTVAKYKVYIIDEVHMLTQAAFNALLKTLEEPPAHIVFILATTEANKIPQTILSRCMRFDFRLVSKEELQNHLAKIFDLEKYKYEMAAVEKIAIHGAGSVRDMLSIADSCMSYAPKKLTFEDVLEVLGSLQTTTLFELAEAIIDSNIGRILEISNEVYEKGKGVEILNRELSEYFRNIMSVKNIPGFTSTFSNDELAKLSDLASKCDNYKLSRILEILALSEGSLRYSSQQNIIFDANLVKAATIYTEPSIDSVISRVSSVEKVIQHGAFPKPQTNSYNVASATQKPSIAKSAPKENVAAPNVVNKNTFNKQDSTPVTPQEPAKPSFSSKLQAIIDSGATEHGPVFEEKNRSPEADKVFTQFIDLVKVTFPTQRFLQSAMNRVSDYNLDSDNVLNIIFKEESSFNLINTYTKDLQNVMKNIDGGKYRLNLSCTQPRDNTNNLTKQDKEYLEDMFGNKLTYEKPNKKK
ncbi:MAG TPA: DNA polymerase III subunit gamma/tau [Clostridia bacterium]|jgi:DNA polymerase-3 subunit gamma/tau|nr:DNA polymerase III subunit gamma/tau [Clostridia bacterium]